MSYPINYPTPQGANVQIFRPNTNTGSREFSNTWVKPQGASMVWFTLIGPGGRGGTTSTDANGSSATGGGGGSGAVTNCMMPAFLIPDTLVIEVYASLSALTYATEIYYQNKTGGAYSLLLAENGDSAPSVNTTTTAIVGAGGAGGVASASNEFSAAGFFQSVAGQDGTAGNISQTTSTTTFLQGGVGGSSSADQVVSQYGYGRAAYNVEAQPGYGVLSPIFVSVASTRANNAFAGSADSLANRNGFGSGGGGSFTSAVNDQRWGTPGGDGLVVIITW